MSERAEGLAELKVDHYTDVIGPHLPMLGPLASGGSLVVRTVQGCWGPMITPELKGGHEVTWPVAVAGALVGDAVAIAIDRITLGSKAAASGVHAVHEGRFQGNPSIGAICPRCGIVNPPSYLKGTGAQAVRCRACDAEVAPFSVRHGYTMVFDGGQSLGLTVDGRVAEEIARSHEQYSGLGPEARQHSALVLAMGDMPGVLARVRPMVGNIGTVPSVKMPASSNAGDFAYPLVGASHEFALTREQLEQRTDGHMDIDSVREGTLVICPVKVPGGGIYIGDAHAMQGDGETAGHTTDVAAEVATRVWLLKGLAIDGPILLPRVEDLPPLARPFHPEEIARAKLLAGKWGAASEGSVAPVQVVGTGPDLMSAVGNGIERLARLAGNGDDEIKNRLTIAGGIEIGRLPGVVQVTASLPLARLDHLGLGELYRRHYHLECI